MTVKEIIRQRLVNQRLGFTTFTQAEQVVAWLGAMQAQEYASAKSAVGLRANGLVDHDVEQAFNDGKILRTHALRPTWHFVTPQDIRWMLMLNKPRVMASMKARWKELGLNEKIVIRTNNIVTKALRDENKLSRIELHELLQRNKIKTDENRLSHLLMAAELDALICSGPRVGKQFKYALLDDRVPTTKPLTKSEALAKLAERYFSSRGPATTSDFVWWSGLTVGDCKAAVATLPKTFLRETNEGVEYILAETNIQTTLRSTFLMPAYDEYGVAYRNRNAINPNNVKGATRDGNAVFHNMIVVDGIMAGSWQRVAKEKSTDVTVQPQMPLSKAKQKEVNEAVNRYRTFIGDAS